MQCKLIKPSQTETDRLNQLASEVTSASEVLKVSLFANLKDFVRSKGRVEKRDIKNKKRIYLKDDKANHTHTRKGL